MGVKDREMRRHRLANLAQTVALIGFMLGGLGLIGYMLAGAAGVLWAFLLGLPTFIASQRLSPRLVLRLYRVRFLEPREAPGLYRITQALAERAGLARSPKLCYVPSAMLNAFTVKLGPQPVIGVTDGLLRNLNGRELAGVLAHEIGHIRNRDLTVMGLADVISRLTHLFAFLGQALLLVALPLLVLRGVPMPWALSLVLMGLPILNSLLQLALSRTREFDADLAAVRLTGDPAGLISALEKIEYQGAGWFERIFLPGRKVPAPSLLRTHPETSERIDKIRALAEVQAPRLAWADLAEWLPVRLVRIERQPRWRWYGLWR